MIEAVLFSGVIALAGSVALIVVAEALRQMARQGAVLGQNSMVDDLIHFISGRIGVVPVGVIVGLCLFAISFFFLTQRIIRYIEELDRAVNQVAQERFDIHIPMHRNDELGRLASNLMRMTARLKTSIEEERQAQHSRYELITSISHDLRTPLTSMLGYLELVEQDRYRDEVELRHYVGIAYDKCRQLKRMIDQLFEFTRTSHGSLRLRPVVVNVGELLEQLAEEFVPALNAAGMEYRLVIPPERIRAMLDPDLMVRVLENLLSNAIRYGHAGKYVDLELARQGAQLSIRVANYGEPISDWELPRIFETFYRVEKSRAARTGGSGLGLAITRNIVVLHGGSINAYNEPGRTVFEVRLPVGAAANEDRV